MIGFDDDDDRSALERFLIPNFNANFWIRLGVLCVLTFVIVRFVATPAITNGESMLPTYGAHQFVIIWKPAYWFRDPQVGDVVAVKYIGQRVMYFKRVVALAGQSVEFRDGALFIDGEECQEWWGSATPCDWNLPKRIVPEGEVYLVGDNRAMPMEQHIFGHVDARRIVGTPLW